MITFINKRNIKLLDKIKEVKEEQYFSFSYNPIIADKI